VAWRGIAADGVSRSLKEGRDVIELMTSDHTLKASSEGPNQLPSGPQGLDDTQY